MAKTLPNADDDRQSSFGSYSLGEAEVEGDMVRCFQLRINLPNYVRKMWTIKHDSTVMTFCHERTANLLLFYIDMTGEFRSSTSVPKFEDTDNVCYFIKKGGLDKIAAKEFIYQFQWGTVRKPFFESLLRVVNGLYAPLVFYIKRWPQSIRNDFSAHLHRFLGLLTDIKYKNRGQTVLYIPTERMDLSIDEIAANKTLVQRLESAMIQWTRQIKEVLNAQEALETSESAGPLEEVEFWKARCEDLSGLSNQLHKKGVIKIGEVMEVAKSSYLAPFNRLANMIQDGFEQAQSNLKFLQLLTEPCTKLAASTPAEAIKLLPDIVKTVRVIWVNSRYFNTRERLTQIFRKISNEVIRICCNQIDLNRIFDGFVISSTTTLQTCIECCQSWKDCYKFNAHVHHTHSDKGWLLDHSSIFAQIDAFIQRCKDLIDICQCQSLFARRLDGDKSPMPMFAGQRGPHISRSLLEIEATFEKHLQRLRSLKSGILDVKSPEWHDEYNRFRAGVKDLEVMVQNLISSAFETVRTVESGVMLLEIFQHLGTRESIKRAIDRKTAEVYQMFNDELSCVKKELSSKKVVKLPHQPKYAGAAHWAKALKRRIDRSMEVLDGATFLAATGQGSESRTTYQGLATALDDYVRKLFNEWTLSIEENCAQRLDAPLMQKGLVTPGMLSMNFDRTVLKLFLEAKYWERILFEIPHYLNTLYKQREHLRTLRELVLLVVRDYNRIIEGLSLEERGLFKTKIMALDKKVSPGLSKLTWAAKGAAEFFVTESRLFAKKVQSIVDDYKRANIKVAWLCREITEVLLIKIPNDMVYEELEFEEDQTMYKNMIVPHISKHYADIIQVLKQQYEVFKGDGSEVQGHWALYVYRMDSYVEEAFRLNIKYSLMEISRAINGDIKTTPDPLFRVEVELKPGRHNVPKVDFNPTTQELHACIRKVSNQLVESLQVFNRLPDTLVKTRRHVQTIKSYQDVIEIDEELGKIKQQIQNGLSENGKHLRNYLTTWDNYKEIWEINKAAFIKRYQRLNPPVASFDADIGRYTEVSNNVQKEETVLSIEFIMLDCAPLKFALLAHCNEWQQRFTTLLSEMATQQLHDMIKFFKKNAVDVMMVPKNLVELGEVIELFESLQANLKQTESQLQPIHDRFTILDKYEVTVPDETLKVLGSMNDEWSKFQEALIGAEAALKKHKEKFKGGLLMQADEFRNKVNNAQEDFLASGPFNSAWSVDDALAKCNHFRKTLEELFEEERVIKHGLNIFKIDHKPNKDLIALEKELDSINQIWQLTKEWDMLWDEWKTGLFASLQTNFMENTAQNMFRKLVKWGRDFKGKNWEIIEHSRIRIDQFRRTMPLIRDLKNSSMRDRHWKQISELINKDFDETADDFTLGKIVELGMGNFCDEIAEISNAATKELAIEKGLAGVAAVWEEAKLDLAPHKDKGHFRLLSTEDLFQMLEDNSMTLTTMKASRFVKAFEHLVDKWERSLSQVMEVVELILSVQRQWLYLENIFMGEDIRKQLPSESSTFDGITAEWKIIMTRINNDPNAVRATHHPGLGEAMNKMNLHLEEIQKSLDMYLETKRQIFPRFYFISNDDLLEILGQSRNPPAVQKHMSKCFDNIKSLLMKKAQHGKDWIWEGHGMYSSEGEYVEYATALLLDGPVEAWLCDVERTMRWNLKEILKSTRLSLRKHLKKRDKWVKMWPGQMVITASQIQWTTDCTQALAQCKTRGDKKALKNVKKKQRRLLNKYSEAIRGNLNRNQRSKIVALVTIEVHARDVIDKMIKTNTMDVTAFEWLQQLRVYWDKDIDDCVVRQTNTQFQYGYEYLGNSGRLVITPLTDRCYVTLTTALNLHRGGSPKGPAGTGKTETTKDLGKALGMYVIVVNCSDGLDYKSMGRMFSGLSQTGAWGCFDEFNRINIEVLSVVAQQILSILSALSNNMTRFVFEGREISLIWSCGMFITMNPGYAGRSELPDNLKSMFRPIAMVVPDSNLIAEILLFGEGFGNCRMLAKKVFTLYSLAVQQLSKQDHYDFGLRALVSILRYAGRKKRANPDMADEEILLLSMKDMNIAKLTSVDKPLFEGVIGDLFPGIETPVIDYSEFKAALSKVLSDWNLQDNDHVQTKLIQLFETKNSRHSTMVVGQSGSGKSVTWKVLQQAMNDLCKAGVESYNYVKEYPINPKALSLGELYGEFDLATNEWTDGVLSSVMRNTCSDEKPDEKWLVFDAPVDTLWIESMNSVMDDNKILTLINGDRITMPDQVSLLFELLDLSVASPATVSRCGMVYFDYVDLGYKPYVRSWLNTKTNQIESELLEEYFDSYVSQLLDFKKKNCNELVPITELNGVTSLCNLYDTLATPANGVNYDDEDSLGRIVEMWFIFSMIWSVCGAVDEAGRSKIDNVVREMDGNIPSKDSVYEYFVDPTTRNWLNFEEKLFKGWKYPPNAPFYKILVPTVDTVRYDYLVSALIKVEKPVLLVGPVGTGKTSVAKAVLDKLGEGYHQLIVNMSSQTTSNNVQDIIEAQVEKRTKGVYFPIGGKKMLCFMDDLNMPAKDTFGSQPPLELVRMWIDYGFWYDRLKQITKQIKNMFLMAGMGPPGGGRQVISMRLQTRFNLINMTFPSETQIFRIFGTMITQKLLDFEDDVKPIGVTITEATIEMYYAVIEKFLPTPAKIHYLFNLRDISKVFQGLLKSDKDNHNQTNTMIRLWMHECFRVFSDRLVDLKDREKFMNLMNEKLGQKFDMTFNAACPDKLPPLFGDFMQGGDIYEDCLNFARVKKFMNDQLEEYNNTPRIVAMDLVLFRDAIEHVTRVVRVIRSARGNMMLIGIGGSGRQSLTRLASYMCEYTTFQIEVTKQYRKQEFREDLKKLYFQTGVENKPTVFLFTDTQAVEELFMEDINNILSSGEVPNLYKAEEFEDIKNQLEEAGKEANIPFNPVDMFKFFIERVRANLHVCLCMSPIGDAFRNRIRQYPAFVNCTTIDLYLEWPEDALLEVAERYLEDMDLGKSEGITTKVASTFVTMHRSVAVASEKMLFQLKRHNYVTPTNYLELVAGYKKLLAEKREELGSQISKLRNGLFKIDDTREKVEKMSVDLEVAKVKVVAFQKECEEYLVTLVQQKREAEEMQKSVTAYSYRIKQEEAKCMTMAQNAQKDLDEAVPALEAAMKALESLNKKDVTEIKSYGKPPALVEMVMQAVMILRGSDPSWAEAKRQLGATDFIFQLMNFDKDNMSDRVLKRISEKFVAHPDFQPDNVGRVSFAAQSLCMWVRAMELYGRVYRVVEPKRQRLRGAMEQLAEKQQSLQDAKDKLTAVKEKMDNLKRDYDHKLAEKEKLRQEAANTELMLERAGKLVSGLAGEKVRWEATADSLDIAKGFLVGDCLIASAFLSYVGPFLSEYRDAMVNDIWLPKVYGDEIPCTPDYSFAEFLSVPTQTREWNIQGLPSDSFSTENGVIVNRGNRWPLMVDPQSQAIKWVKNMERVNDLKVIDLQMGNYLRILERAISAGEPVLLQNVKEELDPSLSPVLNKAVTNYGGRLMIKIGEKEIDYDPAFKFYITTKLANPHYPPEISSKTTIVNFAVKEQGLEAQLLGAVVRKERPELEEQKDSLVINIAAGKKKLKELEDEILRLLNDTKGSLLDDEQLVVTLETSKVTSAEVTEQLIVAEQTEIKIDKAREGYRACASRASILFFVLNDMGKIDPMYQFSLDAFIDLFNNSIDKSQKSPKLEQRIINLNEYHTYAVYRYTCRGLFEKHKMLFSFQMCAKILEAQNKLNMEEYDFFLRGGVVMDRDDQMDNPCTSWLDDSMWDNITELDKLMNFHGIMNSFEQYPRDWQAWYTSGEPELTALPGEWENSCNELQRMVVVRSLRPDRVSFCASTFIINNLGAKFVEPPVLDMQQVVDDSTTRSPLIFVLSTGVDPTGSLIQLADTCNMSHRFHALSLGQGQAPIATRMIKEGVREGNWVFLANCHLSLSWMPALDKLVEQLQIEEPHPDFRLWLSSSPNPNFPISILQVGIKMTTEPPKGLKANMSRLYSNITQKQFSACQCVSKYKKLLFSLCFFHSLLIERKKFLMLGWNILYEFNDSDFEVSENLLSIYLDEYEETPWDALKYLIADVNYGGHVTDDRDRRLLHSYINTCFTPQVLEVQFYKLSTMDNYFVPRDGQLKMYRDYCAQLPVIDKPEAFGQHSNADIASQIADSRMLFETLLSLQPKVATTTGVSQEEKVLELAANVLKAVPENINYENTCKLLADDLCPLNVVLLQEIERYNVLLETIRNSLVDLQLGIQGFVLMSADLEDTYECVFEARVPQTWSTAYPSLKPLGSWTRDLVLRMEQLSKWAESTHAPILFWMSGFTFPTGFLTAVLQTSARANGVSVDSLGWEFSVSTVDDKLITQAPKDGVMVRGLFLEGAGWDKKESQLIEAAPMQLSCSMPSIHFKPTEAKKRKGKGSRGMYSAPVYMFPNRAGANGRESFVVSCDLRPGASSPDHWVKRAAALLMQLSN